MKLGQKISLNFIIKGKNQVQTNFVCNNKELLLLIIKNLSPRGFELKQNKPNIKIYHWISSKPPFGGFFYVL